MKDLIINHEEILKYWNYQKNKKVDLSSITVGNQASFYWICPKCNYEWKTRICHLRYDSKGCPNCNKIKRHENYIKQNNLILSNNSNLMAFWNKTKNKGINPDTLSINSTKKVWWKCEKGHEWEASIYNLAKGYNCPYCANKKVLIGYNDLATTHPQLLSEWDYEKNVGFTPQDFTYGSGKRVWWKCRKGHEWSSTINRRTCSKRECPVCAKETQVSFPEKAVYYYVNKYFDRVEENYRSKEISNKEIDIYIPTKKIGIEYDGKYYHKNKKRDIDKDKLCKSKGIELWHIAEKDTDEVYIEKKYIYYKYARIYDFNKAIKLLLINIAGNRSYDVDVDRDRIEIYNLIEHYEKEKSLLNVSPEISKEWNYEKNGNLEPNQVFSGSQKSVWWKCEKGHEWIADINSRVSGNGCPYCSNQKILEGFNDLATTNPELLKEWDYNKNSILPTMIGIGSGRKVWWKCEKGHSFCTAVNIRKKGCNCPYCINQKFKVGYNDLATTNPELLDEWNYEKNSIKPTEIPPSYRKKVWWKCNKGHEWEAIVYSRVSGKGCPYCSHNLILEGFNDLATTNPELLKYWNYEKNNLLGIYPNAISISSDKKVWFKCAKGHDFDIRIADVNREKFQCPICINRRILPGYNDLATTVPKILKIWDYKKNSSVDLKSIGKGSGKKVWWICNNCGNGWLSKIVTVVGNDGKCPNCKKTI